MASMQGKVIAITGGASGIGLATAKLLHSRGASISIADVDPDALEATATFFNRGDSVNTDERLLLTRVDVSKRAEVDEWIQATVSRFGRLDGAAFLAGVIGRHHGTKTVQELEDDQWDLIMRVNLTGMMYSLRAALKAIENGGSVVCASSVQGTLGFAKHAAYSASKVRSTHALQLRFSEWQDI
jgi:NAD(P)-dependent dehydrogenase (short-subunit alcohol dehydrogenase family)